ncbi:recombinase family protein [Microvirga sp. BT688]|uniref:recombinase family protein n=1 Tax=Microvirga sp. TaxID=1873136 RepID=UPI001689F410|nr:recombinase family protein [Microvirga sp.]MBD2749306.1 recombinase family protein [Microvirga sp.]
MLIGLARASLLNVIAGLEEQKRDLLSAGVEKLFCEQTTSVRARPQLEAAIEFAREGDTLTVTDLSGLGQSVADVVAVQRRLADKGVHLRVLNLGLDTRYDTGQVIMDTMLTISQFEKQIILERWREGIARAKTEGKFKGRTPTAFAKADEVKRLAATGLAKCKIAQQVGISKRSVFRILSDRAARQEINTRPGHKGQARSLSRFA